jgi:LmbE family N-acetylglucosaminyl deacetylase
MLDILVIAPHPDDAELGMAGAIMKFIAEGRRVGVLDLTSGEPTPHGSLEFRREKPKWLFAPYWIDAHPDHIAATELIEAARFWSKLTKTDLPGEPHHPQRIYNYYCIHLKQALQPAFVLDITAEWDRKLASVRAYESQFITGRPTASPTFFEHFEAEAAYWGKTIGVRYGEPFTSREPIGMRSMGELV